MSRHFGLYLGDDEIPVINWINRHGPPEGRNLRFTVPLEAKARLESNPSDSFTLRRGSESWPFELLSLDLHSTGTNGVRAVGRVKGSAEPEGGAKAKNAPEQKRAPAAESPSADGESKKRQPKTLAELSSAARSVKSKTGLNLRKLEELSSTASDASEKPAPKEASDANSIEGTGGAAGEEE